MNSPNDRAATRVRLRDGRRALVRRLEPSDKAELLIAFDHLTPQTRYRRFFNYQKHLSDAQLRYFTELDHAAHEALAAFDEAGEIVGVARYACDQPSDEVAEVAITVADDWQGCGVGSVLMSLLADHASASGVREFKAFCFANNTEVLDLLDRTGPADHHPADADIVELEIDLARGPDPSLLDGIEVTPASG